ncbi:SGNH/GDSL hydrolase family protein [Blastopirellula marina]|uniref:Lipolytic enzyme, G-D-S-L family protein n=1 Tax=Blastopirellula marina DSM 3645 TaxID=314230 RepID=A3ZR13_9BACT|nr:SGNH/GDSL hydrolase family protein [Blastopirellula marina]EAQ81106.1 Lipolytic enzyme, G-D-S-L family protein [Blastopirellula marina DSM 3645]
MKSFFVIRVTSLALLISGLAASAALAVEPPAKVTLSGDWAVQVDVAGAADGPGVSALVAVDLPGLFTVTAERHASLPVYDPAGPQYRRGARLTALISESLTAPDLLDPSSVVVRSGPTDSDETYVRGRDYEFENRWGGIGRLAGGKIAAETPVFISYQHTLSRIDSIVLNGDGEIDYRGGEPKAETPAAPSIAAGERRLANVWIPGQIARLTKKNLFPILETAYPEPAATSPSLAEQKIPRTLAKLRSGEPLRILAWGDSVTDGAYLADPARERWQQQFVARLRQRFPQAKIELVTEAWGGRTTGSYLAVPPGEPHNYQETVLDAKPDLVISEFVNDAGLSPAAVEERYGKLLADFQAIGAEWIILTPHYVRPDWMGLDRQNDIDDDPRPYVQGLRRFAAKHPVALADASLRYGRLWRQGIPYNSLMVNCINHPGPAGLAIFADALMGLFP